jgi:hypothetical protein
MKSLAGVHVAGCAQRQSVEVCLGTLVLEDGEQWSARGVCKRSRARDRSEDLRSTIAREECALERCVEEDGTLQAERGARAEVEKRRRWACGLDVVRCGSAGAYCSCQGRVPAGALPLLVRQPDVLYCLTTCVVKCSRCAALRALYVLYWTV